MRIVKPRWTIETQLDERDILGSIERAGRTCYKSENLITSKSARAFVKMVIDRGHLSVIEHESVTVRFQCDRGVSHEIVRHRLGSYSQESTRYCNYSKKKFGKEVSFIDLRPFLLESQHNLWVTSLEQSEYYYFDLLERGASPQIARSVLPNSLKTEIVVTYNLREWMHFFTLRTSEAAHPQMRELVRPLLAAFRKLIPAIFDKVGDVTPVYKECPECGYWKFISSAGCDTCTWINGDQAYIDWIRYENEKLDKSGQ